VRAEIVDCCNVKTVT